ncbi:MAG: zinc ribbon domain-containing protein [Candidatus Methylomirabilales bacterium]
MPLYEFECQQCGKVFEVRTAAGAGEGGRACPDCGSPRVERLWSPFSSPSGGAGGCGSRVSGFG